MPKQTSQLKKQKTGTRIIIILIILFYSLVALEKYRKEIENHYDMILLDLDMQIMSGFEACMMNRAESSLV